jgi:hypothetical protein
MRKEDRQCLARTGRIKLGQDRFLTCRIANLSSSGAMLVVNDAEWLPKTFALYDVFYRTTRMARIAWRKPGRVGVRFLDDPPARKRRGFGIKLR